MLVAVQRVVKYLIVLYLVTHGLPAASEIELRDLVTAIAWSVLAQLRMSSSSLKKFSDKQMGAFQPPGDYVRRSPTILVRRSGVNGFWSSTVPGSSTPWCTIASSV